MSTPVTTPDTMERYTPSRYPYTAQYPRGYDPSEWLANPGYTQYMDANGHYIDLTDPNAAKTVGWNDYLAARERAVEDYLRGAYTGGVAPDISRALSSNSRTGTFYNRSTDRPNITPEMQPLVDTLVRQYEGLLDQGTRTGSYLPAGYEAQTSENIARAGAVDQARIAEAVPGYTGGGPGDPLAAATRNEQLNAAAAIGGPGGLNDQARQGILTGYNQVYEPFLRTNTKVESGTESSNNTSDAPRSASEILAFLTPPSPEATYQAPQSSNWNTAAQLMPVFSDLASTLYDQYQNRPQTGYNPGTANPSIGQDSGYGAYGSW